MTTTKAANLWPPQHLDESLVKNNAPDNADVVRTLAGNAAAVIGYTKGGAKLDDYTPNPAPRCPGHWLHGHDHSGGVYGYPLRRTIAHFDLDLALLRGARTTTSSRPWVAPPWVSPSASGYPTRRGKGRRSR